MFGPDFMSADWPPEEPLFMREHSSDHRFAVSMRDLAAANGLFLSDLLRACLERCSGGLGLGCLCRSEGRLRLCAEPVLYA